MSRKPGLYDRLSKYDLIIFDVDGTLYFQRGMQIRMAWRLIRHALLERHGVRDLSLILKYRRIREKWDSSRAVDDERIFASLSSKTGVDSGVIRAVITEWMLDRPMDVVRECRDEELVMVIERLRSEGKQVVLYSDYPTEDKCRAAGLPEGIPQFYCGQDDIRTMKPNPSGLFYIMSRYPEITRDRVIMVGDRADRDGAAADNAGISSLILGRFKVIR